MEVPLACGIPVLLSLTTSFTKTSFGINTKTLHDHEVPEVGLHSVVCRWLVLYQLTLLKPLQVVVMHSKEQVTVPIKSD